jgi:hypothetical protein
VPFGLAVITLSSLWLTTLTPDTSTLEFVMILLLRGVGMSLTMMPSMASAYVTIAPRAIPRATSVANVIQRVAAGFGVAVMATVLSNRISANLPAIHGAPGGGPVPPAIKDYVLQQIAKGYDQTFWFTAGIMLIGFPAALLLGRALRADEVRAYAMKQLGEGLVLGQAARRMRDGPLNGLTRQIDVPSAYRLLAGSATRRLTQATQMLQMGPSAGGLVPHPGLSSARKALIVLFTMGALVGLAITFVQAFQTPVIPPLPKLTH